MLEVKKSMRHKSPINYTDGCPALVIQNTDSLQPDLTNEMNLTTLILEAPFDEVTIEGTINEEHRNLFTVLGYSREKIDEHTWAASFQHAHPMEGGWFKVTFRVTYNTLTNEVNSEIFSPKGNEYVSAELETFYWDAMKWATLYVMNVFEILACNNIEMHKIPLDRMKQIANTKLKKKGKKGYSDTTIIRVKRSEKRVTYNNTNHEQQRKSPRAHKRIGHRRHYRNEDGSLRFYRYIPPVRIGYGELINQQYII